MAKSQDKDAWTLAEENWRGDVLREIDARIDEGRYVAESQKTPGLIATVEDHPYDPDILTKKQLQSHRSETEALRRRDKLEIYAAIFRVPDPHAE